MKVDAVSRTIYQANCEGLGLKLKSKDTSLFMKLVFYCSLMFLWNKHFMTKYITTIYDTVYVPGNPDDFGKMIGDDIVLKHEIQHIRDWISEGKFLWGAKYLFPQVLTPLFLLGFLWWPLFIFVLALLPWPAPWRVRAEIRGYAVTIRELGMLPGARRRGAVNLEPYKEYFTGWPYYRMAWKWEPVREKLSRRLMELRGEEGRS